MNSGKSIFAQLMDFLPSKAFRRCVERYQGNYKLRTFSCWDQFLCMAFAQLTFRESPRDIEDCLAARSDQLYHLGFRGRVCRSTLADANEGSDWRIYADLAALLSQKGTTALRGPAIGGRPTTKRLCPRFDHPRALFEPLSVGTLPVHQSRHQAAHALGPARAYSFLYRN